MITTPRSLWLPSASSAVRSLNCPGSVVLPKAKFETTPAMMRGSALHLYLESMLTKNPALLARMEKFTRSYPDQDELAAVLETAEKITLSSILRGAEFISAEEAFAYHASTDSARSLGYSIEREYKQHGWKPTEEIAGTADVILRTPTGLLVGDFKTGHFDDQVSYSWAPQLDMLGLMAARRYGVDSVTVAICLVMDDGRIHWTQERTLDALDLDAIAATVSSAVRGWHEAAQIYAAGGTPPTKQGPWCEYCASRSLCPAWFVLAREFASGLWQKPAGEQVDLTPFSAGIAWDKLQGLLTAAKGIEAQLRDYAKHHPLIMPDGKRLGHVERTREGFDGHKTAAFIRQSHSQAKLDELVTYDFTKAAFERVFGKERAKEELALLRKQNALTKSKYTVLTEIKGAK